MHTQGPHHLLLDGKCFGGPTCMNTQDGHASRYDGTLQRPSLQVGANRGITRGQDPMPHTPWCNLSNPSCSEQSTSLLYKKKQPDRRQGQSRPACLGADHSAGLASRSEHISSTDPACEARPSSRQQRQPLLSWLRQQQAKHWLTP